MNRSLRRCVGVLALAAALPWSVPAHAATVIDFEGSNLVNLYFAGDSFTQGGFRMTADIDFGTVDTSAGLSVNIPGNATQFYFGSNDGGLIVEHAGGLAFSLEGFSAAFVPQASPPAGMFTVMAALGMTTANQPVGVAWLFGTGQGGSPVWADYSDPLDFADFKNLKSVEFFACTYDGTSICGSPTMNNGQFAIDDIRVTAVPEPATTALWLLGLAGVAGAAARRRTAA